MSIYLESWAQGAIQRVRTRALFVSDPVTQRHARLDAESWAQGADTLYGSSA